MTSFYVWPDERFGFGPTVPEGATETTREKWEARRTAFQAEYANRMDRDMSRHLTVVLRLALDENHTDLLLEETPWPPDGAA